MGDYQFLSRSLGGSELEEGRLGNKFAETWMAKLPVPLPRNSVQGIDRQKHHFERPDWSYLAGEWREKGWWHYCFYAAAVKEPLGSWLLGLIAVVLCLAGRRYRTDWRTEWLLIASFCMLLLFISSQRGFNRHLRYALPAFVTFVAGDVFTAAAFVAEPERLVTGCADGSLHVCRLDTEGRQPLVPQHGRSVQQMVVAGDGSCLATVGQDGVTLGPASDRSRPSKSTGEPPVPTT